VICQAWGVRQVLDVASAITFDDDDLAALGCIRLCEVHLLTRQAVCYYSKEREQI
jgi:hypothetical protein